jgi:hypothetical protein
MNLIFAYKYHFRFTYYNFHTHLSKFILLFMCSNLLLLVFLLSLQTFYIF